MQSATHNQWLHAINAAQRERAVGLAQQEQQSRIREILGQSASQARAKVGEIAERTRANYESGEVKRQGIRTATGLGTAFALGAARGAFGDERFMLRGMPLEVLVGIGAHLAGGTVLAGTTGGLVAHGAGDAMLGLSAAHFGRELGSWMRERYAGNAPAPQAQPQAAAAGYAPPYPPQALPPGHAPHALPAQVGAAPTAADRAMAEAIEVMRQHEQVPRAA